MRRRTFLRAALLGAAAALTGGAGRLVAGLPRPSPRPTITLSGVVQNRLLDLHDADYVVTAGTRIENCLIVLRGRHLEADWQPGQETIEIIGNLFVNDLQQAQRWAERFPVLADVAALAG